MAHQIILISSMVGLKLINFYHFIIIFKVFFFCTINLTVGAIGIDFKPLGTGDIQGAHLRSYVGDNGLRWAPRGAASGLDHFSDLWFVY